MGFEESADNLTGRHMDALRKSVEKSLKMKMIQSLVSGHFLYASILKQTLTTVKVKL